MLMSCDLHSQLEWGNWIRNSQRERDALHSEGSHSVGLWTFKWHNKLNIWVQWGIIFEDVLNHNQMGYLQNYCIHIRPKSLSLICSSLLGLLLITEYTLDLLKQSFSIFANQPKQIYSHHWTQHWTGKDFSWFKANWLLILFYFFLKSIWATRYTFKSC